MIVREDVIDLETPTGPMRTTFYMPGDESDRRTFPGLVLYSEIFQLTPPIARLAVQFASHGFVVAVPEIYHEHEPPGTVLQYDDVDKEKGNRYKQITKLSTFDNDAKVVVDALPKHPKCNGHVGAVGFCIGGHLAFRAAFLPEVRAACCFYPTDIHTGTLGEGHNDDSLARVGDIRGELMMIFGRQDPHVPLQGRRTIHEALDNAAVNFTWHEFNCAHAFMRDEGARYDPAVGQLGMMLAVDLFRRNL
ncbi:Carboxymethylenebutenolidase [Planctomycetes bacterium Pan216]|uniref:Carboxymethylenebutenolidase n=1 Tax=Kolteria novifilia TaxID=2527975 RepID=A0A518B0Q6_9BACT|nr:Carboxymethylenebutenolidase [Planctomycetes bacterium Pan216]